MKITRQKIERVLVIYKIGEERVVDRTFKLEDGYKLVYRGPMFHPKNKITNKFKRIYERNIKD